VVVVGTSVFVVPNNMIKNGNFVVVGAADVVVVGKGVVTVVGAVVAPGSMMK
jgi:hypothetical protein